ncbi:MAG: S26 family signal peptidase [Flavobacteriales bacterium]
MRIPEILLALLLVVYSISLPGLLKRAGQKHILGYIPIVNFFPFLKMIKRPWWWFILILIPGVNLIMLAVINVELGIAFNKRSTADQWIFGLLPWYGISRLSFQEKEVGYVGPRDWTNKKKSFGREWGEAIIFAVVAASVIRSFFLEAFTIPTPSMERSMLVGDYLFVSKMSYGAKLPQTPVSIPFVHNTIPGTMINSYTDWFSLPYFRLPGFGEVERFDPVVFNFPHGDTILVHPFLSGHDYYSLLRNEGLSIAAKEIGPKFQGTSDSLNAFIIQQYFANENKYKALARANFIDRQLCSTCGSPDRTSKGVVVEGLRARPVDKKENYIKRCIGMPGDNLEIRNRQVFINGGAIENPEGLQYNYLVKLSTNLTPQQTQNSVAKMMDEFELNWQESKDVDIKNGLIQLALTGDIANKIANLSFVDSISVVDHPIVDNNAGDLFPNTNLAPYKTWTVDNYGPIHIPAKGETIQLDVQNLPLYRRVIEVYEANALEVKEGKIFINGAETTSYTFKMNYYWMMGDNRHNSADSRFWGFVPENHVVGKAVFTWFSKEDPNYRGSSAIRWNRMFRFVD